MSVSASAFEPGARRRVRPLDRLRALALNLLFVLAVAAVAYSLLVTWQVKHAQTLQKAREVERARQALAAVEAQNEALRDQVRFLKTPAGVERLAREKLGLIRPGETAYVVINAPAPPRERSAPAVPAAPAPRPGRLIRCLQWITGGWSGGH